MGNSAPARQKAGFAKGRIMKTKRRWLQSVILAAASEDTPMLPWSAHTRPAALRLAAAE